MSKVHVIQTPESTDNNDNSSKSLPSNWILENKVSQIDLFLIGVTIVIGGQFNGFNAAFDAGYAIAIFNILVTGIGYLCLTFCLAEMTSALPFSGGVYGFVRAFIHPWAGFLIACYELVLNLFYVAYAVYSLAKIPLVIANHGDDEGNDDSVKEADAGLLISYCLVIYVIIGCTCLVGGRLFWSFNNILAFVVLGLLFIYLFGSLPNVDFNKWATSEQIFNDYSIFAFLAQSSGNYLGIQYLPLMSKDIENPRKNIPRAMIGGMLLFVLTAVGLITISCSQSPGITAIGSNINYPLSYGFQDIFSITLSQAKWLSIPGLFSMAFGFLFCYARQSLCMAQSGFLPKCFTWTTPYLGTPYVGLFCGISLCLLINVISFYSPLFLSAVSNISILAGYIVFIATAFAYLIFSSNYSTLSREFSSPLGKFGAVITILIFLFCSIGILGYEPSNISLYVMIAIFIIPSFYYFLFIANHQIFSDEEKDNLFKAYVVNANKAKKTRIMKKHPGKQALITRISGENLSARVVSNSPSGRSNITPVESAATAINQTEPENRLDPIVPELPVTVTDDRPPPPLSSLKRDKVTGKVIHFLTASMRSVLDENKEMKELIIRQSGGLDNNLTPILEDSPV